MSNFASNLSILRRRAGYTQESLAEVLGVSRQAVGKWESGQGLPEAATLITLADLLGCSLDQLMREELTEEIAPAPTELEEAWEDPAYAWETYAQHVRRFALAIAFGVTLILLGVAATIGACGLFGDETGFVALPVLLAVTGAVFLFVFSGLEDDNFKKSCPIPPLCPWPEEVERFRQVFRVGLSAAIGGILLDVALLVAAFSFFGEEDEVLMLYLTAGFMVLLALCVGAIVYLSIQYDAYDENSVERVGKKGPDVEGIIMMGATAIFLLVGFVWNKWHPGWVVFPVGGILCGIVGELGKRKR